MRKTIVLRLILMLSATLMVLSAHAQTDPVFRQIDDWAAAQTDAVNRSYMDGWEKRQARQQIEARANALRAERQEVLAREAYQQQLREREVRALEQMANTPRGPSGPTNCTVQSWGGGRSTMSCY